MKKYKMLENVSHGWRDKDGSLKSVYLTKGQVLTALPPSLDKKFYEIIEEKQEQNKKGGKKKGGKKK